MGRLKDITGKKFNMLKALKYIPEQKKWKCLCDCGNVALVKGTSLRRSSRPTRSCGCFAKQRDQSGKKSTAWRGYKNIPLTYFSRLKISAKARNKEFKISIEYIANLLEKQNNRCMLSGKKIGFQPYETITASIDRIDSSKGYIEGNVQWVHKDINLMKNTLDENYFIELCEYIYKNSLTR